MSIETPTPENPEPVDLELVSLREQLTKSEQQRDKLVRDLAEYDNSRKRAARDLESERRFAHAKIVGDLLPALDNLDRAVAAAKHAGEQGSLVQGVLATQAQVLGILKQHAVTVIEALGQPFDPNLHQAVQTQPTGDYPPNTICQVLQRGFMIHDRVLRPSSVVIATPLE